MDLKEEVDRFSSRLWQLEIGFKKVGDLERDYVTVSFSANDIASAAGKWQDKIGESLEQEAKTMVANLTVAGEKIKSEWDQINYGLRTLYALARGLWPKEKVESPDSLRAELNGD